MNREVPENWPIGKPLRDAHHWETVMRSHLHDVAAADLPETDIMFENGRAMRFRIGSFSAHRQSVLGGRKVVEANC